MAKGKAAYLFELPVTFGDVSIGDGTGRVGFSIDRRQLSFSNAEKFFVGKRLSLELIARGGEAQAGQESLPGADNDVTFTGVFDVKGISLRPKRWTAGATFVLDSQYVEAVCFLPKRAGLLKVVSAEQLPEAKRGRPAKETAEGGGGDDDEDDTEE